MRAHHWATGGLILAATGLFYVFLFKSLDYAGQEIGPRLIELEKMGPQ
jgi:hypothetical protein